MYKQNKCARDILSLQDSEGKWGYFHTHYADNPTPYTTEGALRRLEVLGYTMEDDCIQRAVAYMSDCLSGVKQIPDKAEKNVDWSVFVSLMLLYKRQSCRQCHSPSMGEYRHARLCYAGIR